MKSQNAVYVNANKNTKREYWTIKGIAQKLFLRLFTGMCYTENFCLHPLGEGNV